jgi:ABC-type multidrug transport system ATPase subunit
MATIHQPNTETFNLFTHVLLLAKGRTVFFGTSEEAIRHFNEINRPIPINLNPSDYYLQITNVDFHLDLEQGKKEVESLIQQYEHSHFCTHYKHAIIHSQNHEHALYLTHKNSIAFQTFILCKRGFLNAIKNPLVIIN